LAQTHRLEKVLIQNLPGSDVCQQFAFHVRLMTVNNLNFMRGGTFPTKADAPLVVDTDAVLPSSCYELSQTGHASQGKFGEGNGWTQMDTDSVCHEEAQTAQNFNRETRQSCESSEGGAPRGPNFNHIRLRRRLRWTGRTQRSQSNTQPLAGSNDRQRISPFMETFSLRRAAFSLRL
jgi:hypothetical protein